MSKKRDHGGHHGGAWKVAYADFVTAMMALFIVLWILGSSAETKAAVAAYFQNPSIFKGEGRGFLSDEGMKQFQRSMERIHQDEMLPPEEPEEVPGSGEGESDQGRGILEDSAKLLEQALNNSEELSELQGQVSIEFTSQGLRIQLQDLAGESPIFALGCAEPSEATRAMLQATARILAPLPNQIMIEGHTDSRPYSERANYGNWELSGDRANEARRILEESGISPGRIVRVVGYADRRLAVENDAMDARNRRISIIVCYRDACTD